MKRILISVLCVFAALGFSGCTNNSNIKNSLEKVRITSELPTPSEKKYTSLEQASDAIYKQQIAACDMYWEAYEKTYYQNFIDEDMKPKDKTRAAHTCNSYRNNLLSDLRTDFYKNIYIIIKDCDDCENKDAFLEKANNDVLGFYDYYIAYKQTDDEEQALCKLLVDFSERRNVLALSFLDRNKKAVYEATTNIIENNADTNESYRFYLNKNNSIVSALNDVYGGVSPQYAERIKKATTKLSVNYLNSLENLTDSERRVLMDQLDLSTPSPTPKAAASPAPSKTPTHTPEPTPTAPPVRTAAPATAAPVITPKVTAVPTVAPVTPVPDEPDETERPSYEFSVED